MIYRRIKIENYTDIKKFVYIAVKYGDNLMIKGRNYEFPACSLMSVMSLVDLSDEVKVMFADDIKEEVIQDISQWITNN